MNYNMERYKKIIENFGFKKEREFETWLLLYRFNYFYKDKLIFEIARDLAQKVEDETISRLIMIYERDYEYHIKSGGHFSIWRDRDLFIQFLSKNMGYKELRDLFRNHPPRYSDFDLFRGYIYYYKLGNDLREECRWNEVYENTLSALRDTKGRVFSFLKALIELYTEERPSGFGGFSLSRIQEKIIEFEGRARILTPVDYVTLKAYKIYYKTGSRRYPEHALPIESIPPIEKALEDFKSRG